MKYKILKQVQGFVFLEIEHNVDVKSVQTFYGEPVESVARHKSERTTLRCYTAVNVERAKELHQSVMSNL